MDYEKAYKEALVKLKELHKNWKSTQNRAGKEIEDVFPELAESEDERIRKWIIDELKIIYDFESPSLNPMVKKALAYLEKQKEQKSAEIDEDIELGLDRALQIIKEAKGVLKGYQSDDGIYECDHAIRTLTHILKNGIEQKPEEKPINWTELTWEDINELEDIINKLRYEFGNGIGQIHFVKEVLKKFREYKRDEYLDEIEQKPVEWNKATINGEPVPTENQSVDIPLAEWSDDIIQKAVKEVGLTQHQIDWFKTNVFPPKQEWSEEDERMVRFYEADYNNQIGDMLMNDVIDMRLEFKNWLANRLKSLRPQPKQEWSKVDKNRLEEAIEVVEANGCWVRSDDAVKQVSDFLKSLPERFNLQPKQEWSVEDETMINHIIEALPKWANGLITILPSQAEEYVKRLKSLRLKKNISYGELPLVSIDYMEGLDTDFEKQVGAVIASAMNREHQFTSKYIKWTAQRLMECAKDKQNSEEEHVSDNKEWSEEDERTIDRACVALRAYANGELPEFLPSELIGYADKLQSLRPSWKPTEEQMNMLDVGITYFEPYSKERFILESLCKDLKEKL